MNAETVNYIDAMMHAMDQCTSTRAVYTVLRLAVNTLTSLMLKQLITDEERRHAVCDFYDYKKERIEAILGSRNVTTIHPEL